MLTDEDRGATLRSLGGILGPLQGRRRPPADRRRARKCGLPRASPWKWSWLGWGLWQRAPPWAILGRLFGTEPAGRPSRSPRLWNTRTHDVPSGPSSYWCLTLPREGPKAQHKSCPPLFHPVVLRGGHRLWPAGGGVRTLWGWAGTGPRNRTHSGAAPQVRCGVFRSTSHRTQGGSGLCSRAMLRHTSRGCHGPTLGGRFLLLSGPHPHTKGLRLRGCKMRPLLGLGRRSPPEPRTGESQPS